MYDEKQIEQLLSEIGRIQPPGNSLLRAKNTVMFQVRKQDPGRLKVVERSSKINFSNPFIFKRLKSMPIIALILAVVLGGGGTVAAAQNDVPGDALYGIKLASERVAETVYVVAAVEAEVALKEKLATRRAVEIDALKEKLDAAKAEKKAEYETRLRETAKRLESRIERMEEKAAKLQQKDNEKALQVAEQFSARSAVLQGVLAELENSAEVSQETRAQAIAAAVAIEKLKAKTAAAGEEILARRVEVVGIENAAQGRVGAAENRMKAADALRAQVLRQIERIDDAEKLAMAKAEFERRDNSYQEGVEEVSEAREALARKEWEQAIKHAGLAFKRFAQFASPLAHESRVDREFAVPAEAEIEMNMDIDAEVEMDAEAEIDAGLGAEAESAEEEIALIAPAEQPSTVEIEDGAEAGKVSAEKVRVALDRGWREYEEILAESAKLRASGYALSADFEAFTQQAKLLLAKAEQLYSAHQIQSAKQVLLAAVSALQKARAAMETKTMIMEPVILPVDLKTSPPISNPGLITPPPSAAVLKDASEGASDTPADAKTRAKIDAPAVKEQATEQDMEELGFSARPFAV